MIVKHCLISLVLMLIVSPVVNAQVQGLSITDTAEPAGKGHTGIMGITIQNDKSSLYGGRIAYGVTERLLLFVDIGSYHVEYVSNGTDYSSTDIMGQAGVRYSLPMELPFDLSVRGTMIPYIANYEHYIELTMGLHASRYLDASSNWAIYGYVGGVYQEWELEFDLSPEQAAYTGQSTYMDIDDKTTFALALGATRKLYGATRLFVEIAHTDDYYGCAGIRYDF
ncbi:hypothetical protein ACFL47_06990 [Candidatus Latescibacterota bacterium]